MCGEGRPGTRQGLCGPAQRLPVLQLDAAHDLALRTERSGAGLLDAPRRTEGQIQAGKGWPPQPRKADANRLSGPLVHGGTGARGRLHHP